MEKIRIEVDKVILYYMDRVDPDGNLYRFYVYKGMASEIEYFCTEEAGNMTIPIGEEIEKAEIDLNAKRLKYIKEALVENGGSIKLKFKKWGEDNNAFDFDDQFPVIIEIAGIPMFLTEVYVKKNDFRMVLLDYDDMTLGDFDNTGENEQVAYFINYCLNQDKDGKE